VYQHIFKSHHQFIPNLTNLVSQQKQNIGIVLFLLFIEILAALWYSISFIPFARKMVIAMARRSPCKPLFEAFDSVKPAGSSGGGASGGSKGFTFLADN
jgi:hypothetical protein